ncbi:MAG: phenylalanine--tRNA ligase subunit alpha [Acidimicrobiia bacterium]|nr:phenylalanine--tRNA ligase subunit alpha [Acidimicrobiia bacterium]
MNGQLASLETTAADRIEAASSLDELEAIQADTIGKRSALAELRRGLGAADPDERKQLGELINRVASQISGTIAAKRSVLEIESDASSLAADRLDVTLPGRTPARGTHHLLTQVLEEMVDIFVSMGYSVATGPEAETAYYNFTALNIPPDHPARAETDTLYLDYGDGTVVLRTHTSPMQARFMEANDPPVYLVVPGRVFRRDEIDPTHSPVFHQLEGLAVDENITFADLKGTLGVFADRFFGSGRQVRFLPNYFPFTEPSAEMHVSCFACDGSGCRVCANQGWIELLGCGMVHPSVLETAGYDSTKLTGFAFGIGVDRFAQVRHGISDLRVFFESDLRTLGQFR